MKKTIVCLLILPLALMFSRQTSAQNDFDAFWKSFKTAVSQADKNALAGMTKLPLTMPYGVSSVKTKAQFVKRYNQIFNGETNAAKCFPKAEPTKDNAKRYTIFCGFKGDENGENAPIAYYFELTKTGWKFTGLDNVNE